MNLTARKNRLIARALRTHGKQLLRVVEKAQRRGREFNLGERDRQREAALCSNLADQFEKEAEDGNTPDPSE